MDIIIENIKAIKVMGNEISCIISLSLFRTKTNLNETNSFEIEDFEIINSAMTALNLQSILVTNK